MAGATNDDGSSSSLRYTNMRKEKVADETESFEASARIRAPMPRSGAIADAWRLATGHSHRDGVEGVTVKALESTVIEFKDFDSILVN